MGLMGLTLQSMYLVFPRAENPPDSRTAIMTAKALSSPSSLPLAVSRVKR